jgi:hypothetical protein
MNKDKILTYISQVAENASNCDLQNYFEAYNRQFDTLLLYWKELRVEDDNWSLSLDEEWFDTALIRVVERIMDLDCINVDFIGKEAQYAKQLAIACLGCFQLLQRIRSFARHESLEQVGQREFNDLSLLDNDELRLIIEAQKNYAE